MRRRLGVAGLAPQSVDLDVQVGKGGDAEDDAGSDGFADADGLALGDDGVV